MTVELTAAEIAEKLENFDPAKSIVWLGSGMSQQYPSWWKLVEKLCKACGVVFPPGCTVGDLLALASECQSKDKRLFTHTLEQIFKQPTRIDERYAAIFRIGFKAYVTTNYDSLLEDHIPKDQTIDCYAYPELPSHALHKLASTAVFHIHGSILRPSGLKTSHSAEFFVLSESDFKSAYGRVSLLPGFLAQLFRYQQILFIGCSLEEPEIRRILKSIKSLLVLLEKFDNQIKPREKYFVTGRKKIVDTSGATIGYDTAGEEAEAKLLGEFNIEVLRYADHGVLLDLLNELNRRHNTKPSLTRAI